MRLVDLIEKVELGKLKERMRILYYNEEDCDFENEFAGYLSVLDILSKMTPRESKMFIHVTEVFDSFDDIRYTSVSGYEDQNGWQAFALGFTSWEEWLGMDIESGSLRNYSFTDLLAHILWEMTFFGYTNEEVQEVICDIKETVDQIKSGEADLELVDLDEMFPDEVE